MFDSSSSVYGLNTEFQIHHTLVLLLSNWLSFKRLEAVITMVFYKYKSLQLEYDHFVWLKGIIEFKNGLMTRYQIRNTFFKP